MKRILMLALSLVFVVTVSACGNNDGADKDPVVDPNNGVNDNIDPSNDDVNNDDTNGNTNGNMNDTDKNQNNNNNDSNENDDQNNDTSSTLSGFEEEKTVEEHIDNLDDLKVIVETDNPNKRVILYKEGNRAQYKSIFVKDNNHLKIINIHENDDLLFDGTIE